MTIYVHGSLDTLKAAFGKAGWTEAAANTRQNGVRYVAAVVADGVLKGLDAASSGFQRLWGKVTGHTHVAHLPDPAAQVVASMPLSDETLDGKPAVTSFENNNKPLGGRDHLRIYDTGAKDAQGQPVWAIAASRDTGLVLDRHHPEQGFLNHSVESNSDLERNTVLGALQDSGLVASSKALPVSFGSVKSESCGELPVDQHAFDLVLKA